MFNPYVDTTLRTFNLSADGGKSWTCQLVTFSEMKTEFLRYNYMIRYNVLHRCEKCGTLFHVLYNTGENPPVYQRKCDCEESEFHLFSSDQPTISEFKDFFSISPDESIEIGKLKTLAHNIAEFLKYARFDDMTDSSGYFVVKEFPDGTFRAVDVHKSTGDGTPHYSIYCLYEDETSDWQYTNILSEEELENKLKDIYVYK